MGSFTRWFAVAVVLATCSVAELAAAQVTVSGVVQTSGSTPVAAALLEFKQAQAVVGSDVSATDGTYSVSLPAGTYSLTVTPPGTSGLTPQTQSGLSFSQNTTQNIVLVPVNAPVYAGTVVDRSAAGMMGVTVDLHDASFHYRDLSDASGLFSVSASAANQSVTLGCWNCRAGAESYSVSLPSVDLSGGSVFGATLHFEDRVLTGTVTDTLGAPVANVALSWSQNVSYQSGAASGSGNNHAQSGPAGQFSLLVLPGDGQLQLVAPSGSGLSDLVVAVTVPDQVGDPSAVNVVLPVAPTYSGTVVDRNGTGLAGVKINLYDAVFQYSNTSDANGLFAVTASAADDSVVMDCNKCRAGNEYYRVYLPNVDLSGGSVSGATLSFQDRVLTGTVTDTLGAPVANAALSWSQSVSYQGGAASGSGSNSAHTDAAGQFSLLVVPGDGKLQASAPGGAGLQNLVVAVTVPDQVGDPDAVSVVLPAAPSYSGTVVERNGTGLSGIKVSLFDTHFQYDASTDASGLFSINASAAGQTVSISCVSCRSGYENYRIDLPNVDLSGGSVAGATLHFEDRQLTCAVTDADDKPVRGIELGWSQSISYQGGAATGSGTNKAATDAAGRVSLLVLPGAGSLRATPAANTGLAPFDVGGVAISGDQNLSILAQFRIDSASSSISAGGSVTTDPQSLGPTLADPLETTLTSPVAGYVSLEERPITTTPPSGYSLLTQEVVIAAPASSATNPITIVFALDASRVPPGVDETTLQLFRNGVALANCSGPTNQASPDPCISARELRPDGDIVLTALTSHASTWNVGVLGKPVVCGDGKLEPAVACDDGDACTTDSCNTWSRCEHAAVPGCCTRTDQCNDADACTQDSCNASRRCEHTVITGCHPQATADAGSRLQDSDAGPYGADAGATSAPATGCQCSLAHPSRTAPQGLGWLLLLALARVVRRRRRV